MNKWKALRHDSGEGTKFADTVKRMYLGVNLDPKEVTIIYSDSLDVRKAIELKRHCDKHGLRCTSVVIPPYSGTHFLIIFRLIWNRDIFN